MSSMSSASAVLRLTPRDRVLVEFLQELRYLTVDQIQRLCYPSITVKSVSQRLSQLRARGLPDYLDHRTFTDRRAFWGLTSLGRSVGGVLTDDPPVSPRAAAVASLQMDHLIAINQVFCDLCREHRSGRLGAFWWYGSHHTRIDLGSKHIVPDAVILAASLEGDWWMYSLELDRHTMTREALAEKFDRYRHLHRIAALRREEPLWEAARTPGSSSPAAGPGGRARQRRWLPLSDSSTSGRGRRSIFPKLSPPPWACGLPLHTPRPWV